jgi:hypothetical protein
MLSMRILTFFAVALAAALPLPSLAQAKAPKKFTSTYLDFATCATGPQEGDIVICDAPGDYRLMDGFGGGRVTRILMRDDFELRFEPESGTPRDAGAKVEFRLCDGVPFAIIQRFVVDPEDEDKIGAHDKTFSILLVHGLERFSDRKAEFRSSGRNANQKARAEADGWIGDGPCDVRSKTPSPSTRP